MTDPFAIVILTTLTLIMLRVLWKIRRDGQFETVFATPADLDKKLEIIRRYKGFQDPLGLDNEEIIIKAVYVNPYKPERTLSYLIYVPKIVLTNARYEDSKKRFEDIFKEED